MPPASSQPAHLACLSGRARLARLARLAALLLAAGRGAAAQSWLVDLAPAPLSDARVGRPRMSWADSYVAYHPELDRWLCHCATTCDHGVCELLFDTQSSAGVQSVGQICADIETAYGPGAEAGRAYFNDIQCGNGPVNGHMLPGDLIAEEIWCPGTVAPEVRCGAKGPRWDLGFLPGWTAGPGALEALPACATAVVTGARCTFQPLDAATVRVVILRATTVVVTDSDAASASGVVPHYRLPALLSASFDSPTATVSVWGGTSAAIVRVLRARAAGGRGPPSPLGVPQGTRPPMLFLHLAKNTVVSDFPKGTCSLIFRAACA